MSSRHSKGLNATACMCVCTCPHLIVCQCAHIMCVCRQPLHVLNLCVCVCGSVRQKGGPLLGLCQHRKDERMQRATASVGGKNSSNQPSYPLHPTSTTWAYKCFLLKLLKQEFIATCCHCTDLMMPIMHIQLLEGKKNFFVMWDSLEFIAMLISGKLTMY